MHTAITHVACAALVLGSLTAGAQAQPTLGPIRVTLVAGPTPTRGGRTEVVRQAHRVPATLVIVDRSATVDDLAAALATINLLRLRYGDSLTIAYRARPESVRPGPTWQKSEYRTWLIQQLVRLRAAPQSTLGALGVVRAVDITLPAPRRPAAVVTSDNK